MLTGYTSKLIEVQTPEGFTAASALPVLETGCDEAVTVYTLQGTRLDNDLNALPAGIYILRQGPTARKVVKK